MLNWYLQITIIILFILHVSKQYEKQFFYSTKEMSVSVEWVAVYKRKKKRNSLNCAYNILLL